GLEQVPDDVDLGSVKGILFESRPFALWRKRRPSGEHDRSGTLVGKPSCGVQAEVAHAADDQVDAAFVAGEFLVPTVNREEVRNESLPAAVSGTHAAGFLGQLPVKVGGRVDCRLPGLQID